MKRIILLLLAVFILLCVYVPVNADTSAKLTCTASTNELYPGDEVTVTVSLNNAPNAKSVALVFDYEITNTFSLVGGEWLLSGAMLSNFDSKTTACGTAAIAYMSAANVNGNIFRLTLRAQENAVPRASTVKVTPVIKNDASVIECSEATISITVMAEDAECSHGDKVLVEAKASTTEEQGWDSYYVCSECGQLFAADGVTEIDEIPYLPLLTPTVGAILTCTASKDVFAHNDDVVLTVSLSNSPDVKSIALVFDYDVTGTFDLIGGEWLLTGAMLANFDRKTTACGTAAIAYASASDLNGDLFTLRLRVKENAQDGKYVVKITPVIKNDATVIPCDPASVELTVSQFSCTHENKTAVEEKESTCDVHGWDAYYCCDDCGQLFADDGVTEIDEVPFRPFRQHAGGEATCKHLAVCDYCGKPYGDLDPDNHKGETETRGKIAATCTTPGYTGNVYCLDCGAKLSSGTVLEALGHHFLDEEEFCLNGCGTRNPDYHPVTYYLRGDADGNGEVNILDATAIQRYLAGLPVNRFNYDAACITGDSVSILGATAIQRWLAAYTDPYLIGQVFSIHSKF